MIDETNPTTQFHEYQAPDSTPNSEKRMGALGSMLSKIGIDGSRLESMMGGLNTSRVTDAVRNMDVSGSVTKARDYARSNPSKVLGGLAIAVIGAGLLARSRR